MNIILIGSPGSGKGTQAQLLTQALGMRHMGSGDLFRKVCEERTPFGMTVQGYVDRGELVPDALTVAMILKALETISDEPGVVVYGFPRTLIQAQALDYALDCDGRQPARVFYLNVPLEEVLNRIIGRSICQAQQHVYNRYSHPPKVPGVCDEDGSPLYQRSDDVGDALRRRLVIYFNEVAPIVDYYKRQNRLREVNGNQSIEQIHQILLEDIQRSRGDDRRRVSVSSR